MSSIAYLRSSYGIPAKKGMRVKLKKAYFNIPSDGGVITGAKHAYLRIRVDGEKHSRFFHPTYGVIYPAVEHGVHPTNDGLVHADSKSMPAVISG